MKSLLVKVFALIVLLPACNTQNLAIQSPIPPTLFASTTATKYVTAITPTRTRTPTNTAIPTSTSTSTLTATATQTFDINKVGTVEKHVDYCVNSGIALKMDVYYPNSAAAPWSTIILIHGGRWTAGDKAAHAGLRYLDPLLAKNFLVVSINYRLAPDHPFPANIIDVKCAIRSLRANAIHYNLHPLKIGLLGTSAGAHLSSLAGLAGSSAGFDTSDGYPNTSSRVQAVASLYGPTDFSFSCKDDLVKLIFEARDCKDTAVLSAASPLSYVGGNAPPFLLIHGEKDKVVIPKHSKLLHRVLSGAGAWVKLILVENAGHGFLSVSGPIDPKKAEISKIIVDFFVQKLQ
ncbi:MAG: alpha/beta hydrolase [Chloroflexota bacterium]